MKRVTKTRCWHMPASSHIALSCLVCSQAISRQGHPTPPLQAQHGRTSKAKPEKAAIGFLKFALVKPDPKKRPLPTLTSSTEKLPKLLPLQQP